MSTLLIVVRISGSAIATTASFFFYLPISFFTYIVLGVAFLLYIIVIISVIVTFAKIIRLILNTDNVESKRAMQALALQLILSVVVIFLLLITEIGSEIGIGYIESYIIRSVKEGFYFLIALLFYPSLIRPSKRIMVKR
ncbi:MAG: hypothetical protein ACTSXU_01085 [Promethearchaeota archaeon]